MRVKFLQNMVSLSDFKLNAIKIIKQTNNNHKPVILTNYGKGVAVIQGLNEFKKNQEKQDFMRAVAEGLMDIKQGNVKELSEVKKHFGL